ncbi:hypothetical protein C1701_08985 [Actinoalloteichus sp. AHMU CJ021]|uniref:S8 family serine peptidase n=1 Tax=Actinoalloteichus sp. AHMU CJ021 TaxID=2072503 RepID=UPI000CA04DB7|nr:hypothetical protein C1701_08985 [Actinoalloteichus sp. AHMU CJ021]
MGLPRSRIATLAALCLLGAALGPATAAASPDRAAAAADPPPTGSPRDDVPARVTLVTGDQVFVRRDDDGPLAVTGVRMAEGRSDVGYTRVRLDGQEYVYPLDALPLVAADRIDERLFNVSLLVDQGFDDLRSPDLSLLATGADVVGTFAEPGEGAGVAVTRTVPGLDVSALTAPKEDAAAFWEEIRDPDPGATEFAHASGGQKLWLNQRLRPTLVDSVAHVGAATAWEAGHTGEGVTVAVLDTGYDPEHPDLVGNVAGAENFVDPDAPPGDGVGHGTHVAATIAGSGAASDGAYRGVAPDADLLHGTVCDDYGCPEDAILAGMRWAVDSGARVVNLSLGGGPSDGTDPLAQAINQLTEETGALFVVAAGNFGQDRAVASPGSADAALTVGASTKSDELADFSSRGPRVGDAAVKPEISAPGESIGAARAAGTGGLDGLDEHHVAMSGTSMAAPHVAGAAAVLAQAHPEWDAAELKAALVSTAREIGGTTVYGQGAGRLDLARASGQRVHAEPGAVSFGSVEWPVDEERTPAAETVVLRNGGAGPVDLELDIVGVGGEPPAGMFGLSSDSVTVPAGGEVPVEVTVDHAAAGPGGTLASAALVAEGDGDVLVRVALGAEVTPETSSLRVEATAYSGQPAALSLNLVQSRTTGEAWATYQDEAVALPPGDYRVLTLALDLYTPPGGGAGAYWDRVFGMREVSVGTRDEVIRFDGTAASDVRVRVEDPAARPLGGMFAETGIISEAVADGDSVLMSWSTNGREHVLPSGPADGLALFHTAHFGSPELLFSVGDEDALELQPQIFGLGELQEPLSAPLVDVGDGAELPDVDGAVAVLDLPDAGYDALAERIGELVAAGASAVWTTGYPEPGSTWDIPVLGGYGVELFQIRERIAAGADEATLTPRDASAAAYLLHDEVRGGLPDGHEWSYTPDDLVELALRAHSVRDAEHRTSVVAIHERGDLVFGAEATVPAGTEQRAFVTPGPWSFEYSVSTDIMDPVGVHITGTEDYQPGGSYALDLLRGPFGPRLTGVGTDPFTGREVPFVARTGDSLRVNLPMLQGQDTGARGMVFPNDYTGETVLSSAGTQVGRNDFPGMGTFLLDPEEREYRLAVSATRDLPGIAVGTEVRSEWTFPSARTGDTTPLPLLGFAYRIPLDLENAAPAGAEFTFGLGVHRQEGSDGEGTVGTPSVEYSADGGETWSAALVEADGPEWLVSLRNPGSGVVALRTTASDGGVTYTETLPDAYRLR